MPINEKWLFILLAAFNSIFIKISLFSNNIKQLRKIHENAFVSLIEMNDILSILYIQCKL